MLSNNQYNGEVELPPRDDGIVGEGGRQNTHVAITSLFKLQLMEVKANHNRAFKARFALAL